MNDLKTSLVLDEVKEYFSRKPNLILFTPKYTYKENFRSGVLEGKQSAFYCINRGKDSLTYIPIVFYKIDELDEEAKKLLEKVDNTSHEFSAYIAGWDSVNGLAAVGLIAINKQEKQS